MKIWKNDTIEETNLKSEMPKRKVILNNSKKEEKKRKVIRGDGPNFPTEIFKLIFELLSVEDLISVRQVCKKWNKISSLVKIYDIILVCDITFSCDYLKAMVLSFRKLLPLLSQKKVRIGFVGYRDHEISRYPLITSILSTDLNKVFNFMNKVKIFGGEDFPEAVLDGLNSGVKMFQGNNSNKTIFLICDAPPHGRQFIPLGNPHLFESSDKFPDGCPCGLEEISVINEIREKKANFYILGRDCERNLSRMILVFKNIMPELIVEELEKGNYTSQMRRIFESILI